MFKIREDIYRRRELADKLKIAFATAAHVGAGMLMAWSVSGKNGLYLYAGSAAFCFTAAAALSILHKMYSQPPSDIVPFDDIAPVAREIAQRAGMEPPQVFHAVFEGEGEGGYRMHGREKRFL